MSAAVFFVIDDNCILH